MKPSNEKAEPTMSETAAPEVDDLILISVDDHVVETPGLFYRHLPARSPDQAPGVERPGRRGARHVHACSARVVDQVACSPAIVERCRLDGIDDPVTEVEHVATCE